MIPPMILEEFKHYLKILKDGSKDDEVREALETLENQVISGKSKSGLDMLYIEFSVPPVKRTTSYCLLANKLSIEFTAADLRAWLDNLEGAEPTVEMQAAVNAVRDGLAKKW